MSAPITVDAANAMLRYTLTDGDEGRAALECLGKTHPGAITSFEVVTLDLTERTIAAGTGLSAGAVLPIRIQFLNFVGVGLNPQGTLAAWTALGSDALRDNAIVLDDTEAPIGSTYTGFSFSAVGAVTGCKKWLKTAAATWTDLTA